MCNVIEQHGGELCDFHAALLAAETSMTPKQLRREEMLLFGNQRQADWDERAMQENKFFSGPYRIDGVSYGAPYFSPGPRKRPY